MIEWSKKCSNTILRIWPRPILREGIEWIRVLTPSTYMGAKGPSVHRMWHLWCFMFTKFHPYVRIYVSLAKIVIYILCFASTKVQAMCFQGSFSYITSLLFLLSTLQLRLYYLQKHVLWHYFLDMFCDHLVHFLSSTIIMPISRYCFIIWSKVEHIIAILDVYFC